MCNILEHVPCYHVTLFIVENVPLYKVPLYKVPLNKVKVCSGVHTNIEAITELPGSVVRPTQ